MKWCVLLIAFMLQHYSYVPLRGVTRTHQLEAKHFVASTFIDSNNFFLDAAAAHIRRKRIVGGFFSPEGLFPYAVSLRIYKFDSYMHFCGGAIISDRYILSTAHCMLLQDDMTLNCYKGKYVGSEDMTHNVIAVAGSPKLDSGISYNYKIDSYMYHSDFSFKLGINDISLLKTVERIKTTKNVKPIAVFNMEIPVGSIVIVPGWGLTTFPGDISNTLKFIDLRTISYEACAKAWKKVYKSQICTYTTLGEGVCTSDSGGPLVYKGELVGLVSFGKPCAVGHPDVFTNVSHMSIWIDYNMKCLSEQDLLDKLLI